MTKSLLFTNIKAFVSASDKGNFKARNDPAKAFKDDVANRKGTGLWRRISEQEGLVVNEARSTFLGLSLALPCGASCPGRTTDR